MRGSFHLGLDRLMRRSGAALAVAAALALAGCFEDAAEPTPLAAAEAALERGDGFAAEAHLKKVLTQDQERSSVAAMMGEAKLLQENLPEARKWLENSDFDDATRGLGFLVLARLEMREGNLPAAGAALDRALEIDRDNAETWVDIGRLRYRGGEQLQAIEAADRAVKLDPSSARALHFKGQLVRDAHGLEAALAWFEAALAVAPNDRQVLADYAATLGELGRAKDMLAAIRTLARVDPGNKQVYYLQAVLAARAGKTVLARSLLQRSGEVERDIPAAMMLSALIDMQGGNHSSASQMLARLNEMQPDNRRVQVLLARSLQLSGSEAELAHEFGKVASRPSASPYLLTLVGRAHEALGEREQAAYYLDRAAEPRTNSLIAMRTDPLTESRAANRNVDGDLVSAVRALIVRGNTAGAASRMGRAVEQFPGSADVLSLAGDAQFAQRNLSSAFDLYQASARVRRPWPLTRRAAMTYRARGNTGSAEQLLVSHLRGDPGNGEAAELVATGLADRGDTEAALALLDHALGSGTIRDPAILAMYARLLASSGELERGLKLARKAHAIQPNNPEATAIRADLERSVGAGDAVADILAAQAQASSRTRGS